jgi:hypothetical protein
MTVRLTKKDYEYLRTLKSGAQQRVFNERTSAAYRKEKEAKARKATTKFVEALPPMQKDIALDAWLDDILKKD